MQKSYRREGEYVSYTDVTLHVTLNMSHAEE